MSATESTETPAPYVVLVTGSRQNSDTLGALVHRALDVVHCRLRRTGRTMLIRHGACPTGADAYAAEWVRICHDHGDYAVSEDRHPADWSTGRSAGPRRNKAMVDLGADIVLAFPVGASPGTRGCMQLAEAAGLTIEVPNELRDAA